jgi:glycosyltransferase involved in cell wall biosynthesis
MRRDLVRLGVDASRVVTIPNGVDTNTLIPATPRIRAAARDRLRLDHDRLVYLFVGRLVPLKGVSRLLDAWNQDPPGDRQLLIVGDGPEREALEAVAAPRPDIQFAGHQEDIAEYLCAADVFVLPSTREGQSIALLEAMASGTCVVASDIPANRELFPEARLFRPDDAVALRAALVAVEDPEVRSSVAAAARLRAEEHSVQAMTASVGSIYQVAQR